MKFRPATLWTDHAGRFSWLKAVTLLLVPLPGLNLALAWATHALGGRPVTEVIHGTGDWAVRFLLLALAVTPARAVLDWPRVVLLRRMLGLTAAAYAGTHLTLYCVDQKWRLLTVASEIALRFYLTIGFTVILGLVALSVTSTDAWQKHLGARWKSLHRLLYPMTALALFHYFLQSKSDVTDAVFFSGLFAWLMLWRAAPRRWQGKLWLLPLLALGAALATACIEGLWYALATGVDARRVLLANLDIRFGLRPALQVGMAGLLLFAAAAGRRGWKRLRRRPVRTVAPA